MKGFNELERAILDQIEKLNDDSIGDDIEKTQMLVDRSKAISSLTNNLIDITRVKIEVVKTMDESGGIYEKYMGIESK